MDQTFIITVLYYIAGLARYMTAAVGIATEGGLRHRTSVMMDGYVYQCTMSIMGEYIPITQYGQYPNPVTLVTSQTPSPTFINSSHSQKTAGTIPHLFL